MFHVYCTKVLNNKLIDYMREISQKRNMEVSIYNLKYDESPFTQDQYFTKTITHNREKIIIENESLSFALEKLDKVQLNIILDYYYYGMTDKEISKDMGVARSTICEKRHEAVKALYEEMRKDSYE